MQLYPHKLETTFLRSFVDRTTRFTSCVLLYCYDPPIKPRGQGHWNQDFPKQNIPIKLPIILPINLLTGRDPIGPPIYRDPDLLIKPPIFQMIYQAVEFPKDETNTRPTTQKPSPSRSTNRDPDRSHNLPIKIMISWSISRESYRSPNWSHNRLIDLPIYRNKKRTPELSSSRSPE